jgi:hypothetical protein
MGSVSDEQGRPLDRARVTLSSSDTIFRSEALSDQDGHFELTGLPAGRILVVIEREGYNRFEQSGVVFEPAQVLYLEVSLGPTAGPAAPPARPLWVDLSNSASRTTISEAQINALPSANNIWSVMENQDLSATTNRIDVGGMWSSQPALFSSRGSVSWTQSRYLINGMDVTDPYLAGTPLYYPDLFGVAWTQHSNGQHPVSYLSPGGYFDLIPKQGTSEFHGAVSAFFSTPAMSASNITPALREEGLTETNRLRSFQNYNVQLSGPVLPGRMVFFTSLARLDLTRDLAEFEPDDRASLTSGLINLNCLFSRSSLQLFWTGQTVHQPTYGAARKIPPSATLDRRSVFSVFQVIWRMRIRPDHSIQLGASFSRGDIRSDFQKGVTEPHGLDIFTKVPSGAAAAAGGSNRTGLVLQGSGEVLLGSLARYHHRLEYGFCLRQTSASSEVRILDDYHLHFYDDAPVEVVVFNTPLEHRERALDLQVFVQETLTFPSLLSLSLGLNFVRTRGWAPVGTSAGGFLQNDPARSSEGGRISWANFSPRLAFTLPFSSRKRTVFRVSAARYYFELPLWYLAYGNPSAPGGLAYPWLDRDHDGALGAGETGPLWRREGPYFTRIDPGIKRPYTDELVVVLSHLFANNLSLTLAGFYRETGNLVETLNEGVPLQAYNSVQFFDAGDDFIPGTQDDQYLTVYDQKEETLGRDIFLFANPFSATRISRYRGLDLTLVKKFSRSTVFFFSATATEAVGTANPGNTAYENDDGVVGALYDNPNASLFAKGRLRFDRAYTARLGASAAIPLGFRLAALVKYYDGQPFARKIIIAGFNQGPFFVQAFYRGQARYEFNMTVDVRLEKVLNLGRSRGRIFIDGYNIFNWPLATRENEWTGPEFVLRYATEIQSPRVFRLGFAYEF